MRDLCVKLRSSVARKLLAAILAAGLPAGAALAYDGPPGADDFDARIRAVQYSLDRDKTDLETARRRVDSILAAREKQLNELSALRQGGGQADHAKADLDRATQDQARLRDRLESMQKNADTANAKIEPIHAAALGKFESTDSFKTSFAAFDKARQELKVPTDAALDQLSQTREFQDRVAAARTAKASEDKLRQDKNADPAALAAAEDAFIAADNKVQDLEEKCLTADPKIVEGRKRVDDAQAVLRQLRDQMEQDLLKDPTFAASVDEMHKQQAAMDAATADLKKLDAQIADLRGATDRQPVSVKDNRTALIDAELKLDTINGDLAMARQDVGKFESRVQEDQDSLNYARRDAGSPPDGGPVYGSDTRVYVPADSVTVYSPPVYYGPSYGSGVDVSIGYGYYPGYYHDRYYYNHDYYGGHDWHDRGRDYRDYSYRGRVSDDRYDRSRDRSSYTDHSTYRDTRSTVERRGSSTDYSAARTARDLHAPQSPGDVRRSTSSDVQSHNNSIRAQEDVHGRRVTEAPARSEPRTQPEPSRAAHSSHVDAPAPQVDHSSSRSHETPAPQVDHSSSRSHEAEAPHQSSSPTHSDSGDSGSRSHTPSR